MSKRKITGSKKNLPAAGLVLLAVLLLASCTREDHLSGDDDGTLPALGLNTLQAKDLSEVATRAAATVTYPTDKFIGFFVKENTTNGYPACDNRKGEYNTARKLWLPVPDSIWLNNHDADIAVYAPYDATQTTAAKLKLAACLRPDDGSKDVWCKKFTANNQSANLAPVLEHVYTRFIVSLSLDADYKGTAPVDSVSLDNDSLYAAGAFRPFETVLYEHEGEAGVGFTLSPVKTLTTAAPTASIDLLLIPATLTADIKLSLRVNGITFGVKIASSRFAGKLEAGKQYNANVKLKPTALEVTSVTINDWNDVTVSGDKEPEFVEPEPIDIGLDFVIAPGNLRGIKLSGGGYMYAFAFEQGYCSGDALGGDYFNWNTLSPVDYTANQTGEWNNAQDPCSRASDGSWRTPTKDDLQALIDKGYKWGTYKMKDGATVSGNYFGTKNAVDEAHQDSYPFFPYVKYRSSGGSDLDAAGTYSDYWSSTPNGSSNAYCLNFNSSSCATNNFSRNYGFLVRCVKDNPKELPPHAIEVEGLDFYVADGNVRAISNGTGGYTYQFAEEQGYYSGVGGRPYDPSGGDYFVWNTLVPGPTNTTQSSWDDARDPCRQIGDKTWYTPTQEQLKKLEDLYNNNKAVWGTYTMNNNTTIVEGMYFGVNPAPSPAEQDNYLFLPAAGSYFADYDRISNVGSNGVYLSSTNTSNGKTYYNGGVNASLSYDFRVQEWPNDTDAYSIRCVRDK